MIQVLEINTERIRGSVMTKFAGRWTCHLRWEMGDGGGGQGGKCNSHYEVGSMVSTRLLTSSSLHILAQTDLLFIFTFTYNTSPKLSTTRSPTHIGIELRLHPYLESPD